MVKSIFSPCRLLSYPRTNSILPFAVYLFLLDNTINKPTTPIIHAIAPDPLDTVQHSILNNKMAIPSNLSNILISLLTKNYKLLLLCAVMIV